MSIGTALLETLVKSGTAALEGAAAAGKFQPKGRRKRAKNDKHGDCTPCAAMERRELARKHVAAIVKGNR